MKKVRNIGVILSAGKGVRAGGELPKQYRNVQGKMIVEYVIEAFKQSSQVDIILIAAEENREEELKKFDCVFVAGGIERNDTVQNVIDYVKKNYPECEKILFHDSARPMITAQYIDECFSLLDSHESVITTAHITDSLGKKKSEAVDRSNYYLIQTPEAFRFDMLEHYFRRDSKWTAIVQQLPKEASVYLNYNLTRNIKITYQGDFEYFRLMIEREQRR